MTDPNTPTPDPVEDRVRRTFAARAEDIVSGDSTSALPDLGHDGRTGSRRLSATFRPALAAAVVIVVAAATVGVARLVRLGDRDSGRQTTVAEQPPVSDVDLAAPRALRALIDALQNERSLATATLVGIEQAIGLPVTETTQARRDTDAAVAGFEAFVADAPNGAAYQSGLDSLDDLDELRRDIDSDAGPYTLDNLEAAQDVFDGYQGMVGALLDDQEAYAETIDDPITRTGAVAYGRGLRLRELTTQLFEAFLTGFALPRAEQVAEISRLRTEVLQGLDSLVAETAGTPFAQAAVTAVGQVEGAGLLDAAARVTDGTGVISLVAVVVDKSDDAWLAFLDRVEEILTADG